MFSPIEQRDPYRRNLLSNNTTELWMHPSASVLCTSGIRKIDKSSCLGVLHFTLYLQKETRI